MLKHKTLQSLGRAFAARLEQKGREYDRLAGNPDARPKQRRCQWIGTQAQQPWIDKDLRSHCGALVVDPLTAVSNGGDPRRTDVVATVAGEIVEFELKKSAYAGERVASQLACQLFDLGLGTRGASALYIVYGETGRIDAYTREDAKKAVDAVLNGKNSFQPPEPAEIIYFGPSR